MSSFNMTLKVSFPIGSKFTKLALKWFFTSMGHNVPSQISGSLETLGAIGTNMLMWTQPYRINLESMTNKYYNLTLFIEEVFGSEMCIQSCFLGITSITKWTWKWLFSSMNQNMSSNVDRFFHYLRTIRTTPLSNSKFNRLFLQKYKDFYQSKFWMWHKKLQYSTRFYQK